MTQAKTQKKTAPKKVSPPLQLFTAFVCDGCEKAHPLTGLYVLYRALVPPVESRAGQVQDLLKDYLAPARLDRAGDFTLAVTDALGYLSPLEPVQRQNPWSPTPDTHKLSRGQDYLFYFVHHPDPRVARRYHEQLLHDREITGVKPLLLKVSEQGLVKVPVARLAGDHVQLPRDGSSFLPRGHDDFGALVLFGEMPTFFCDATRALVTKLQGELGKLRYVIGRNVPYVPTTLSLPLKGEEEAEPLRGIFSAQTMNAVYAFQQDANRRRARRSAREPTDPWDYLAAEETVAAAPAEPLAEDGVFDRATAATLIAWRRERLSRQGRLLVPIQPGERVPWMRDDAARRYLAWHELVRVLADSEDGVVVGSTFRSIYNAVAKAGPGKAVNSLHKTGAAIDLDMVEGYRPGSRRFPIEVVMESAGDNARWRLYLPAKRAVPGDAAAIGQMIAGLRSKLRAKRAELDDHPKHTELKQALDELERDLGASGEGKGAELLAALYPERIRPFRFDENDPYGGQSLEPAAPAGARSWLDLTLVAQRARIYPISSAQDWDQVRRVDAGAKKLRAVTILAETAAELRKENVDKCPLHVFYGPDREDRVTLDLFRDVELELVEAWVKQGLSLLKEQAATGGAGSSLVARIGGRADAPPLKALKQALSKLGAGKIRLQLAGESAVLEAGQVFERIEQQITRWLEEAPVARTDRSAPSRRRPAAEHEARLTPVLLKADRAVGEHDSLEALLLAPATRWELESRRAVARCREWWHFQATDLIGDWFVAMEELGWRQECLLAGRRPELHHRPAVGYFPAKIDIGGAGLVSAQFPWDSQRSAVVVCKPLCLFFTPVQGEKMKPGALRLFAEDASSREPMPLPEGREVKWIRERLEVTLPAVPLAWAGRTVRVTGSRHTKHHGAGVSLPVAALETAEVIKAVRTVEAATRWTPQQVLAALRGISATAGKNFRGFLGTHGTEEALTEGQRPDTIALHLVDLLKRHTLHRDPRPGETREPGVAVDLLGEKVALSHVLCGLSAGLRPQQGLRLGVITLGSVDNRYAVTLAGDLGQSVFYNYVGKSAELIGEGSEAQESELVGDIDGLLLGQAAAESPDTPISEHLHRYYCGDNRQGALGRYRRFTAWLAAQPPDELKRQVNLFVDLYARADVPENPLQVLAALRPDELVHATNAAVIAFQAWLRLRTSKEQARNAALPA